MYLLFFFIALAVYSYWDLYLPAQRQAEARRQAEVQRQTEAKAKAEAEAKAREDARLKAEAQEREKARLAAAEEKAAAEAKMREEARLKAEAEEWEKARLAAAAEKAAAEAEAREEARLKAEANAKARAEAAAAAQKAAAEAKAGEEARLKAEAQEREKARLAAAEQKAAAEAKAREAAWPKEGKRWTNSLGQIFVPVPGTKVLFCVWDTRVKDYHAYAAANSGVDRKWENPVVDGEKVTPREVCPVVNVSWEDATSFCAWLTKRELALGRLAAGQRYRLPTDAEWSVAVGLENESGITPKEKKSQSTPNFWGRLGGGVKNFRGVYPWGTDCPPPRKAGNYRDRCAKLRHPDVVGDLGGTWIEGYDDGYALTSPVGSFAPNRYGLFDMSGNVRQWCEDYYVGKSGERVLRGGSYLDGNPWSLLSSYRFSVRPDHRSNLNGFRCVLVVGSAPSEPVPATSQPTSAATSASQTATGEIAAEAKAREEARLKAEAEKQERARPAATETMSPATFEAGQRWTNGLGMVFAGVPGAPAFSIWETRAQDYQAFRPDSPVRVRWEKPSFTQGPTHPVVQVSWDDAQSFCQWLTIKERREGRLSASQHYRLPTDAEWSVAVGLNESRIGTPKDKDVKAKDVYPWGTQWPPPRGAGNYHSSLNVDSYDRTSPVGSFGANRYGIYDLGGNVWEWCEDYYDGKSSSRVLRGASWDRFGFTGSTYLLSSFRDRSGAGKVYSDRGFRCVLVSASFP